MSVNRAINPIALRQTKIAYNFDLSECNRVNGKNAIKVNVSHNIAILENWKPAVSSARHYETFSVKLAHSRTKMA